MTTSRFSATALDLSRVDRSTLWAARSFESIRLARIADLQSRLTAAGVAYDVTKIETDPGVILQETGAYRELLNFQAQDDAQAKVLLAFSWGVYLDELGRQWGTARMVGADGTPETDSRYRARIQLAPEAFSATGTLGGYLYHTMAVDLTIRDASVAILGRGTPDCMVEITVLSTVEPGTPSSAVIDAVRARQYERGIKLLTDVVTVRPAQILQYDLEATQYIRPGPDPVMVRSNGVTAARATADTFKRIGGIVPANVFDAALYVPNVDRVVITKPTADLSPLRYQAGHLRNVTLKTVVTANG